jgi:cbb3-type cytochrome oxidase subunit 3
MQFNQQHRNAITQWYVILLTLLFIGMWWNGMLLSQMQPEFFTNKLDVSTWLLMRTGLHKAFLFNKPMCIIFDSLLLVLPIIYLALYKLQSRWQYAFAWLLLIFTFVYYQCYTLYPTTSIEGYIGYMLMPLLFTCISLKRFYFTLHFLRYVFLFFFLSAGLWKLRNGGFFNGEQMSAVLLMQHKEYLVSSPDAWLTNFYNWLIAHKMMGWCLFAASTFFELSFAVGFFTKNLDRWLIGLFVIFLLMDVLVMRIYYFDMAVMLLTLGYSKWKAPN